MQRTTPGAVASPPDWTRVSVSLNARAHTQDGGEGFVLPGTVLHSGDKVEFHVAVARPYYVYLVQVFPNRHAAVLYPAGDEPARLQPSGYYRIPTDPNVSFVLDDRTGIEQVVLIASERPLDASAPELADALRTTTATGQWPSLPSRPSSVRLPGGPATAAGTSGSKPSDPDARLPPDPNAGSIHGGPSTRGRSVPTGSSGRALDVQDDASHVAAATFSFVHDR